MGVRRAMEMVLAEANRGDGPLFTFGPLIHNNQVLNLLASKGVQPVDDLDGLQTGRIVIRAHGILLKNARPSERQGSKSLMPHAPKLPASRQLSATIPKKAIQQ